MKYIAHRGNINGPNVKENQPDYILETIKSGYDCEIDVRYINDKLFLGHDNPDYEIDINFLIDNSKYLWIHCKNIEALDMLLDFKDLNIFWHQEDNYTITTKGFIWCYPKMISTNKSIILMPEWNNFEISKKYYGICSDYILKCIEIINKY
jgi:hypothetical protein